MNSKELIEEYHVYTDGACSNNQNKKLAIAGVGVWFGDDDERNVSEKLEGEIQTNNRAELTALIRAIEVFFTPKNKKQKVEETDETVKIVKHLILHTDSQYCKDGIEKWIVNWKKNGWKTSNKKPVKNKDLWEQLDRLREEHPIKFEWVRGHSKVPGNEKADKLAVKGCTK